ncbi:hypothetical protein ILYODFUR_024210 [Ilyodon furcidens]|uniref:Uncharacterized protein n=1 Tax=Ilyodon furcidens TaxID=33524 RepID=A0ABV0TEK8_9TELE
MCTKIEKLQLLHLLHSEMLDGNPDIILCTTSDASTSTNKDKKLELGELSGTSLLCETPESTSIHAIQWMPQEINIISVLVAKASTTTAAKRVVFRARGTVWEMGSHFQV